jgi:hypothetical protein
VFSFCSFLFSNCLRAPEHPVFACVALPGACVSTPCFQWWCFCERFQAASSYFFAIPNMLGKAPFHIVCVGRSTVRATEVPSWLPKRSFLNVKYLRAQFLSCLRSCLFFPWSCIGKQPSIYLFFSRPACFLIFLSPSANHLLASTS